MVLPVPETKIRDHFDQSQRALLHRLTVLKWVCSNICKTTDQASETSELCETSVHSETREPGGTNENSKSSDNDAVNDDDNDADRTVMMMMATMIRK